MAAANKIWFFVALLVARTAGADDCSDAVSQTNSGMGSIASYHLGSSLASQTCKQALADPGADPQLAADCGQIGAVEKNPKLQEPAVQKALTRFEKTFGIPRERLLQSLAKGNVRALMVNRGIPLAALNVALAAPSRKAASDPAPAEASARAPKTEVASATAPEPAASHPNAPTDHAGFALRDQLRLALRRDSSARAGSEAPTIAGLLPIQGDPLFQSAETDESLTLFQVVHLRYETLAPRLR